jgi:hypothetical protein
VLVAWPPGQRQALLLLQADHVHELHVVHTRSSQVMGKCGGGGARNARAQCPADAKSRSGGGGYAEVHKSGP